MVKNMYKKNLWILVMAGLLSIILLSGIILYSFRLQEHKDETDLIKEGPSLAGTDLGNVDHSVTAPDPNSSDSEANVGSGDTGSTSIDSDTTPEDSLPEDMTIAPTSMPSEAPTATPSEPVKEPVVLAFAGDINLDEDSRPVARYDSQGQGILGCISPELIEEMTAADIMMLNNEFAYSLRGTEEQDKSYTFRAAPKRVDILKEMGVDIVSLANNHALDFGREALMDTFSTLEEADIDYVGAGHNLDRAKSPIYYTLGDKTIAYVAASRVVFAMDWYASDTESGMIGTYDPTLLLEVIKEAAEQSDFVVVYVHWGVERTNYPVDYQKSLAKQYIDAGADAVIGCHPHVLQGLEFYNGKPIAYSLGNYWFNNTTREAGLLKLILSPEGELKVQLLPTLGENTFTSLITNPDKRAAYFKFMEDISYGVSIDEEGYVTEAR